MQIYLMPGLWKTMKFFSYKWHNQKVWNIMQNTKELTQFIQLFDLFKSLNKKRED